MLAACGQGSQSLVGPDAHPSPVPADWVPFETTAGGFRLRRPPDWVPRDEDGRPIPLVRKCPDAHPEDWGCNFNPNAPSPRSGRGLLFELLVTTVIGEGRSDPVEEEIGGAPHTTETFGGRTWYVIERQATLDWDGDRSCDCVQLEVFSLHRPSIEVRFDPGGPELLPQLLSFFMFYERPEGEVFLETAWRMIRSIDFSPCSDCAVEGATSSSPTP
jgi:hypothetical protein